MWKIQDFSITQILCEINFGDSRSAKTAVFDILGAVKFDNVVNFSLERLQKIHKNQNPEPFKCVKMAFLHF